MAMFSMELPPALDGADAQTITLRKYVARLVDRLMYTLNNIDDENLVNGGISAGKFRGGAAGLADTAVAQIGTGNIGRATVQHLTAQVAEIVTAMVRTAVVDWANLKHIVGDEAIVARFVGERMFVDRLAVTAAQAVEMWVGTLCVRADDGHFYKLNVDPMTGQVTATQTTVTPAEYDAGQTAGDGRHIIESSIAAEELSASSISAVEALISRLTAARIDVDQLFAREATIQKLTTGSIASLLGQRLDLSSNESIRSTVQQISGEAAGEVDRRVNTIEQTLTSTRASVQDILNGIGTHFLIETDKIRITQDQNQGWELQLTAQEMRFLNRSTQAVVASFGINGAVADRMQSKDRLSVGTDARGWYDMSAEAYGLADKWRNGTTAADRPAVILKEPEDAVVEWITGTHSGTWPETFGLAVEAENVTSCRWQYRYQENADWTNASFTGNNSLTPSSISMNNTRMSIMLRCRLLGYDGRYAYTRTVRVRYKDAPVIVSEPPAEVEAQTGGTYTLSCLALNAASYQWQVKTDPNDGYQDISGETGATMTRSTPSGTRYIHCTVRDADGRVAVTRDTVVTVA